MIYYILLVCLPFVSIFQSVAQKQYTLKEKNPNVILFSSITAFIALCFFIFAERMLRQVQILPSPSTIIMINRRLPENTGGAAARSTVFFCFLHSIHTMPMPASRNPMDCRGRNKVLSA